VIPRTCVPQGTAGRAENPLRDFRSDPRARRESAPRVVVCQGNTVDNSHGNRRKMSMEAARFSVIFVIGT
jgi:hypothetical protein